MSVKVFVYGTLRIGDHARAARPDCGFIRVLAQDAYLAGFQMLNLGGFPGLIPAKDRGHELVLDDAPEIRGEVHEYEDLKHLDAIEGYHEKDPDKGLFNRVQVTAYTPDDQIEDCWVYTFNVPQRLSDAIEGRVIESGDWFKHRRSRDAAAGQV